MKNIAQQKLKLFNERRENNDNVIPSFLKNKFKKQNLNYN